MVRALNPPAEPNEGYWAQLLLFQDMRCRCVGVGSRCYPCRSLQMGGGGEVQRAKSLVWPPGMTPFKVQQAVTFPQGTWAWPHKHEG